MFKIILLVAALVPAMVMAAVNFRACPNGAPTPTTLTVNECTYSSCSVKTRMPLHIVGSGIISPVGSSTATARVLVRVEGWKVCYELPSELTNACQAGLFGGCPIVAGTPFSYALILNQLIIDGPLNYYPVEFEIGLIGDSGIDLLCARFTAIVYVAVD